MEARRRRPPKQDRWVAPRSDAWVSADPVNYLQRLRALCRTARQRGSPGDPYAIIYVLGIEATQHDPEILELLRDRCRQQITTQLAAGQTVFDPLWQAYNLAVRALEQITEQQRAYNLAVAARAATHRAAERGTP